MNRRLASVLKVIVIGASASRGEAKCKANQFGEGSYSYDCIFPFTYQGVTYNACTTDRNAGIPWCRIDGPDGDWGECENSPECKPDEPSPPPTPEPRTLDPTPNPTPLPPTPVPVPDTPPPTIESTPEPSVGTPVPEVTDPPSPSPTEAPVTEPPTTSSTPKPTTPTCLADQRGDGDFDNICLFPFKFQGVTYNKCITVGQRQPWCAISTDGAWGNCASSSACPIEITAEPTTGPEDPSPTASPQTPVPTILSTVAPQPTASPTSNPTRRPTTNPTRNPTRKPTLSPTLKPSNVPATPPPSKVPPPDTSTPQPTIQSTSNPLPTIQPTPPPVTTSTLAPAFSGLTSVVLSPMLLKFVLDPGTNRQRLLSDREEELVELVKAYLLESFSMRLPDSQQPSDMQLVIIDESLQNNETLLETRLLGSVYFNSAVTSPPSQRELNELTKESLESEDFLRVVGTTDDPVLSSSKEISLGFTDVNGNVLQEQNNTGGGSDNTVVAIVASVCAVVVCVLILGFGCIVYPRMKRRHLQRPKNGTPQTAAEGFFEVPSDLDSSFQNGVSGSEAGSMYTYGKDDTSVSVAASNFAASVVGPPSLTGSFIIPESDSEVENTPNKQKDFVAFDCDDNGMIRQNGQSDESDNEPSPAIRRRLDGSPLNNRSGSIRDVGDAPDDENDASNGYGFNKVDEGSELSRSIHESPIKPPADVTPRTKQRLAEDTRDWKEKYGIDTHTESNRIGIDDLYSPSQLNNSGDGAV